MRWLRLFAFFLFCGTALAQGPGIQNPPTNIAGVQFSPSVAVVGSFSPPPRPGIFTGATPFYISGDDFSIAQDDPAGVLYVSKNTNYTGAPLVGTPPAIYGVNQVGPGVQGSQAAVYAYAANSNTANSQPAGTAGVIGSFGIGACSVTNCAATWGGTMAAYDTSGQSNPPNPLIGLEVDNYAHGTDASQNRVGVDIVCGVPAAGTINTCGTGLLFGANGVTGQFTNLITGATSTTVNGITLAGMTMTGTAYNSPGFAVDHLGNITGLSETLTGGNVSLPVNNGIIWGSNTGSTGGQMVQLSGTSGMFFDYLSGGNWVFRSGAGLTQVFTILAAGGASTTSNITAANHLTTASLPTITLCGSGTPAATAGSSNAAGQITIGTGGTVTACTMTFAVAYPTAAFCTVSPVSSTITAIRVSAQSKSAFTVTFAPATASQVFQYTCGGN